MKSVYQKELGYQRTNARLQSGFFTRLGSAGLAVSLIAALWVIALEIGLGSWLMRVLPVRQPDMRQVTFILFFAIPIAILAPAAVIFHFYTLIRTLIYAASAIMREKEQGTWDALVLTRLSSWQILSGKAWATSIHLLPTYALLAFIRYAAILCWSMTDARSQPLPTYDLYWFPSQHTTLDQLVLLAISVWVFTLINLPLTTSFGLLGGLLNWKQGIPFAFGLRTAVVGLIGLMLMATGALIMDTFMSRMITIQDTRGNTIGSYTTDMPLQGVPMYYIGMTLLDTGRTLLDNGVTLHNRWVVAGNIFFMDEKGNSYPLFSGHAILASLSVYLFITAGVLFTAHRVTVRQGGI